VRSGEWTPTLILYEWRGAFANAEMNPLHAEGFGHHVPEDDWVAQVTDHSLGWVTAREPDGALAGFVNVAWDGGVHAFLIDTVVAARLRRQGIGRELVRVAGAEVRKAGCRWLHVDYGPSLRAFYEDACGFRSTPAGLIDLAVDDRRGTF
jgi:GNAT superfamily N-acetyltransferase